MDLGNLRASGFVLTARLRHGGANAQPGPEAQALAKTTRTAVSAVVGFGGPATRYALVQHERTDYKHTVGEAKYLEKAVQANASQVPQIVQRHMERVKRRGPA